MSEPSAQRTLVKSPPELWAEISDVEALARHLGAFGEIRITRVVPETTVAWEGETARGTVELSASGWGTKVTLRATPTDAQPTPVADAAERAPGAAAPAAPHWSAPLEQKVRDRYLGGSSAPVTPLRPAQPVPAPTVPADPAPPLAAEAPAPDTTQPEAAALETSAPETPAPALAAKPPRGLLARLRWWFSAEEPAPPTPPPAAEVPEPPAAEVPAPPAPAPAAAAVPESLAPSATAPAPEPPAQPNASAPDPIALRPREPAPEPELPPMAAQGPVDEGTIVGILTGVLDELGSARHRPFSRG